VGLRNWLLFLLDFRTEQPPEAEPEQLEQSLYRPEVVEIDSYQRWTISTARYPGSGERTPEAIVYVALGLTGESGEVAEKVKKTLRGDKSVEGPPGIHNAALLVGDQGLLSEMGDVLYYLSRLAAETGFTMSQVMEASVKKLEDRKLRGKIHGDGDKR
jgi:NTP pyrophosphatase (non-canonical NTP hydrolase)